MSSLVAVDLVLCLPRRGPVVSLRFSRTPFARCQMRLFISHTCLNFGASPSGVLSKTLNCSLAWCVSSHDCCRAHPLFLGEYQRGSFIGGSDVWLTTVPYGTRSFSESHSSRTPRFTRRRWIRRLSVRQLCVTWSQRHLLKT